MSQMKALYEKVAASEELRAQFTAILQSASEAGEEDTSIKLIQFAKDQGFSLTISEFQEFFKELEETNRGELSDAELDMVAGGKSDKGIGTIVASVVGIFTFGLACAMLSAIDEIGKSGGCAASYQ